MFKKGSKVRKLIIGGGFETISEDTYTVSRVVKGIARVTEDDTEDESCLEYDAATGCEVNAAIPGFTSRLISRDGH